MNDLALYTQVPAHVIKSNNSSFLAGLPQGDGFPQISLSGTRFVIKSDGVSTPIPTVEIDVIMLGGKETVDRAYYTGKFDHTATEAKSPDCYSETGVQPNGDSPLKQCESCAGCPLNQYGSGTDLNGNPSKGKACKETKRLAIFINGINYGFKIPPTSLKYLRQYVLDFTRQTGGADLCEAITTIGFDPNFTYPVLSFKLKGWLNAEQSAKINQIKNSLEVAAIIGGTAALVAPAVASAPVLMAPTAQVSDPFAPAVEVVAVVKEKPLKVVKAAAKPVEQVMPEGDDELARIALDLGL